MGRVALTHRAPLSATRRDGRWPVLPFEASTPSSGWAILGVLSIHDGFHSLAERRSWALHCEVASRLADHPGIVQRARARVEQWLADPARHPYAAAWKALLDAPMDELSAALRSKEEPMITLRQVSPFAGALDTRTRWRILKQPDLTNRETR